MTVTPMTTMTAIHDAIGSLAWHTSGPQTEQI